MDANLVAVSARLMDGFLFVNGTINTSEIVQHIKKCTVVNSDTIELTFNDGSAKNYSQNMGVDLFQSSAKEVYCQAGKMQELAIKSHEIVRVNSIFVLLVVFAENGSKYAFDAYNEVAPSKLFVSSEGSYALCLTDSPRTTVVTSNFVKRGNYLIMSDTRYVVNGGKILVSDLESDEMVFKELKAIPNVCNSYTKYYVNDSGKVINIQQHADWFPIYEIDGNYYERFALRPCSVVAENFPLTDAIIMTTTKQCVKKCKYVKDATLNPNDEIYDILVTMQDDKIRKCCMATKSDKYYLVFEDSSILDLI